MTKRKKPLILITNDDGFRAKGINELIQGLRGLGELVVLAPDGPRSGMASAITSLVPINYKLIRQEEDLRVYSC
ncbi:MAG TPA: 5'/3'-nucleotidase SurE, partial [Parabacteroides sp.]|nr:5'/3'-nucleotidase SurE [Parabacteroides sp.]